MCWVNSSTFSYKNKHKNTYITNEKITKPSTILWKSLESVYKFVILTFQRIANLQGNRIKQFYHFIYIKTPHLGHFNIFSFALIINITPSKILSNSRHSRAFFSQLQYSILNKGNKNAYICPLQLQLPILEPNKNI